MPSEPAADVANRDELLAQMNTPEALARRTAMDAMLGRDRQRRRRAVGRAADRGGPGDLAARRQHHQPADHPPRHRRRAAVRTSSTVGAWRRCRPIADVSRVWGKIIAANGVVVVMVDFRNCVTPSSSVPEVAPPFPAGLNDCVSEPNGPSPTPLVSASTPHTSWWRGRAVGTSRSPPGWQLKRDGAPGPITALRALPVHRRRFVAAGRPAVQHPQQRHPARPAQQHRRRDTASRAFEARDPLAWPLSAARGRSAWPARTVISERVRPAVRRGRGVLSPAAVAGVAARGRMVLGTMHGTEIFAIACPEISRDTARDLAAFAAG
ncbi:MAG: hypothetical protein R2713_23970 [Ilumatobacteraceae bacterium]